MQSTASTSRAVVATPGVARWLEPLLAELPPLAIVDAHTHLGADGRDTIATRAVVFDHDNDAVIAAARASAGRLVPFCTLNGHPAPVTEGRRAIEAGARGLVLHPRSEGFALAHEHNLPVLVRGVGPLGGEVLRLAEAYPRATLILAHAAIADLAWLHADLGAHPNVLIDTASWNPADLLALFTLVPPGRIVFGSDGPFGSSSLNALLTLRCALEAGLGPGHVQSVMGGQLERVLAGEPLADLGPPIGSAGLRHDPLLARVTTYLAAAWGAARTGGDPAEPVALARRALRVDDAHPHHSVCGAALQALDAPTAALGGAAGVAIAACLVATPHVATNGARGRRPTARPTSSWLT